MPLVFPHPDGVNIDAELIRDYLGGGGSPSVTSVFARTGAVVALTGDYAEFYQPLDATLSALAGLSATAGLLEQTGADAFTKRAIGVAASTDIPTRADADTRYQAAGTYQPLDGDLTAIAALATTSFGRSFLPLADAAAGRTLLGLGALATLASPLTVPNGGTGATSFTAGRVLYGAGTAAIATSASLFTNGADLGLGTSALVSSGGYATLSINGASGGQIAFKTGDVAKHYIYSDAVNLHVLATGRLYLDSIVDTLNVQNAMAIGSGLLVSYYSPAGGDRSANIDFYSADGVAGGYSTRIIRTAGANGNTQFEHKGTGFMDFHSTDGGFIAFTGANVGFGTTGPLSTVHVIGSFSIGRTAVNNAAYTMDSGAQKDYVIAMTNASAPRAITLVAASTAGAGRLVVVKDETGNALTHNITIDASGAETIDGSLTKKITTNYGAIYLYCSGAAWFTAGAA